MLKKLTQKISDKGGRK